MDIPNYDPNDIRMEGETECPNSPNGQHDLAMVVGSERQPTCAKAGKEADLKCQYCDYIVYGGETQKSPTHTGSAEKVAAVPATCTTGGTTSGTRCSECKVILSGCTATGIDASNHNIVDGKCTRCGNTFGGDNGVANGTPSDQAEGDTTPASEPETTGAAEAEDTNISVAESVESIPVEDGKTEAAETDAGTLSTEPIGEEDGHGLFGCNPFTCGCWIYLLLALVIGVVLGYILGSQGKKKKRRKSRTRPTSHPVTEVDYAIPAPVADPIPVATMQSNATGITAAVHHHVGARKDQQDSYGVSDLNAYATNGILAIVADGMGGLANGKAVSSNLVHGMLNYFRQTSGQENVPDMMLDMLTQSNDQINRMLQGADRSGSTLVSAIVRGGYLHFLTVGDSRIYLYRHGVLLQLNREHIYQEELALKAVNHIVPIAQVTGDRQAHALTSYLGIGRLTHLDRNYEGIKLEPGDKLLLASDGVFGTLSQEEMEEALRNGIGDATDIIGEKIRKANMQYQDNNTALVLEYHG